MNLQLSLNRSGEPVSFPALLRALQEAKGGNSPSGQEALMFSAICFSSLLPRPPAKENTYIVFYSL